MCFFNQKRFDSRTTCLKFSFLVSSTHFEEDIRVLTFRHAQLPRWVSAARARETCYRLACLVLHVWGKATNIRQSSVKPRQTASGDFSRLLSWKHKTRHRQKKRNVETSQSLTRVFCKKKKCLFLSEYNSKLGQRLQIKVTHKLFNSKHVCLFMYQQCANAAEKRRGWRRA